MRGITLLAVAVLSSPIAAAETVENMIVEEIACRRAPDPTPILLRLLNEGRLSDEELVMADNVSCWVFAEPMTLGSVDFSHVCASHEDPAAIDQYPALYFRGPGTSAGTGIGLVAGRSSETIERWADESLDADDSGYTIEPSAMIEGGTEISCNSLYRDRVP
jgi:hypothetical protein